MTDYPPASNVVQKTDYNATFDLLRFAGAIVIVLFHTGGAAGGTDITAVSYFALVMTFLALNGFITAKGSLMSYMRSRAKRLLWPFFVWGGPACPKQID